MSNSTNKNIDGIYTGKKKVSLLLSILMLETRSKSPTGQETPPSPPVHKVIREVFILPPNRLGFARDWIHESLLYRHKSKVSFLKEMHYLGAINFCL